MRHREKKSNNSNFKSETLNFLEKNKCIFIVIFYSVLLVIFLIVWLTLYYGKGMVEDYSHSNDINETLNTNKVSCEEGVNLVEKQNYVIETSEDNVIVKDTIPSSINDFVLVVNAKKNKIKNMAVLNNVYNYDEKDKYELNAASKEEDYACSLDTIACVIQKRENVFKKGNINSELSTLLGNSYLHKSEYEVEEIDKLNDLRKSREYFLKNLEIIQPSLKSNAYLNVVISTIRIIEIKGKNTDDYKLFHSYINILAYSSVAQEKFPNDGSANYYVGYSYHKLFNIYINNFSKDHEICMYLKSNAIKYYKKVDVNSNYYNPAMDALDDLE